MAGARLLNPETHQTELQAIQAAYRRISVDYAEHRFGPETYRILRALLHRLAEGVRQDKLGKRGAALGNYVNDQVGRIRRMEESCVRISKALNERKPSLENRNDYVKMLRGIEISFNPAIGMNEARLSKLDGFLNPEMAESSRKRGLEAGTNALEKAARLVAEKAANLVSATAEQPAVNRQRNVIGPRVIAELNTSNLRLIELDVAKLNKIATEQLEAYCEAKDIKATEIKVAFDNSGKVTVSFSGDAVALNDQIVDNVIRSAVKQATESAMESAHDSGA